jgi:hypothetical protein
MGCTVISLASSGVRHRVKKSYFSRMAINSGKNRPAWRIIQTGGRSTVSPFNALKNKSFFIIFISPARLPIGQESGNLFNSTIIHFPRRGNLINLIYI